MIRLGVTGHRPNRLQLREAALAARVRAVLGALIRAAGETRPGPVLDVQSPLADGADRIVAGEAFALGQHVTAMLPLDQPDYEKTFVDAASAVAFREMLAKAGMRIDLAARYGRRKAAYAAIGMMTVARSDLILTIWDGKEAQGQGGTPEILQAALDADVPVIWIDAVREREAVLLRAVPREADATCVALSVIARHSEPLTEATYRALVAAARASSSSSSTS